MTEFQQCTPRGTACVTSSEWLETYTEYIMPAIFVEETYSESEIARNVLQDSNWGRETFIGVVFGSHNTVQLYE